MVDVGQPTGREAVIITKAMFQRVLSGWAVDVLELRRRGWDKPCFRTTGRGVVAFAARQGRPVAVRRKAA